MSEGNGLAGTEGRSDGERRVLRPPDQGKRDLGRRRRNTAFGTGGAGTGGAAAGSVP